ncbi:MAG: toll/interleukin-1 receptor domain-containing protein [Verrucomicrobia bacterium]|jgi:hypothetical protein|nr:toll/interleukin-1 receptor domain-containing protein [Verrucomicrobiota bacterium]
MPRDQVFISYSHTDKEWLERLQKMLSPLVRNETISVWDDTMIPGGRKVERANKRRPRGGQGGSLTRQS